MKVLLITICYNEEKMMPHFINYYSQYCDKMIFFDGGSTDKTHQIIESNSKCELNLDYVSDKADDYTFLKIKNNSWKQYKNEYDWCIIVDIDEFLYYPQGLKELFRIAENNGCDIIHPNGFNIISEKEITENSVLFSDFRNGGPDSGQSKNCAINIKNISEINYTPGCHHSNSIRFDKKDIKFYTDDQLKLLHYKYLGLQKILDRKNLNFSRLSEDNLRMNFGVHNTWSDDTWISLFNEGLKNSKQII